MSTALDALRTLQGSGNRTADLIAGRQALEDRVKEMKRNLEIAADPRNHSVSGATQVDVADAQSDLDASPEFGLDQMDRIGDVQDVNDSLNTYNRPDVGRQREAEQAVKLRLAGEPARVAGQSNIEAAKVASAGRIGGMQEMAAIQQMLGGGGGRISVSGVGSIGADPSVLQTQKDDASMARIHAGTADRSLIERLKALQTGKAHAARPGGIMDMLTGPSQKSLDDAEVASLIKGGGASESAAGFPPAGTMKTFPNGRSAVSNGKNWVAQ